MRSSIFRQSVLLLLVLAVPLSARAQGSVALRGGVSNDPKQGFVGAQMEWTALAPHTNLSFRPDVEIGFGSGITLVTGDILVAYWVPLFQSWRGYLAAGPAAVYSHIGGGCDQAALTCAGANALAGSYAFAFGLQSENRGLFFEVKTSGGAAPSIRFAVGIALKRTK